MMKLSSVPPVRQVARAEEDAAASAPPLASPPADFRGLIDNATSDRLYGWAWDAAHPEHRLMVELRLGGEPVASTIADFGRPDLAGNGVGDGCHAFEFALSPDWADRRGELTAVAFGVDGTEFPIPIRLRRPDNAQAVAQLHRAMEGLLAEQQQIRAEFAELRGRTSQLPGSVDVDEIAKAGRDMQQRLDSLELWISRLDGRLGEITAPRDTGSGARLDPWQAVLLAVLASVASVALALAAARYLA